MPRSVTESEAYNETASPAAHCISLCPISGRGVRRNMAAHNTTMANMIHVGEKSVFRGVLASMAFPFADKDNPEI